MAKGYKTLPIEDFSGGWNPRDAASQVADNESPVCFNVTLDERGGVVKRLGVTKTGARAASASNATWVWYSKTLNLLFCQIDTNVYKSSDEGVTWSASIKTFSTNFPVAAVDFLGKVVFVHAADGCFHYDGTTFTGPIANAPKGIAIAVWQNYLWTVGDFVTANAGTRVTRSDAGAITWPASPTFVDLRYKDDEPCTAIGGGVGMDEAGRGGLLVFKAESCYRIHDSTTLANTVVDYNYGAGGPRAIVNSAGMTMAISRHGIIAVRGDYGKAELVSDKLRPLFTSLQTNITLEAFMAAGEINDRCYFTMCYPGDAPLPTLTLEFDPRAGWFVPHFFSTVCFTNVIGETEKLVMTKLGISGDQFGYIMNVFEGATDDGSNIPAVYQTRWFAPYGASDVRFRRLLVNGLGSFTLYVQKNYDNDLADPIFVAIDGSGTTWGSLTWGTDTSSTSLSQDVMEVYSLGHGRSVSFVAVNTTADILERPPMLTVGGEGLPSAAREMGAFALYGLTLDMVPLGAS